MNGLAGSSIVVTGAARGIGLAVTKRLIAEGADVYAVDVARPGKKAAGTESFWHRLDVSDEAAVMAFFRDSITPACLDGLINCAGVVEDLSITESSLAQWDEMLRHNLSSTFVMTREFTEHVTQAAAIVNVGSVDAHFASPRRAGYAAAKGGIEAFTRLAASQLADKGIRVNAVVPGAIATRMTPDPRTGELCLLRRRGTADEVASAIAFLVSNEAAYITGATLHVDGGFGLR